MQIGATLFACFVRLFFVMAVFAAGISLAAGLAMAVEVPRLIHPWGRFEPGAWKIVRATTESFDTTGQSLSITETRAALEEVNAAGVAIRVEVLVEVAGKRFRPEPQIVRQGFHGEPLTSDSKTREIGPVKLTVQGRTIDCEMLEVECSNSGILTVSKIAYSPTVPPYIFLRESTRTDLTKGRVLESSRVEVNVLEVPCRVGLRVLSAAQTRAVQTFPSRSVVTLSLISNEVPGGVVCQTAKETDESGRLIRRTTLELVDFGLRPGLRYSGGLRWRLLPRHIYALPEEWVQPGLLPETQGLSSPSGWGAEY
ncbi:MAG: hypothetical protein ACUVQG_12730 [Thermogutta sp.]